MGYYLVIAVITTWHECHGYVYADVYVYADLLKTLAFSSISLHSLYLETWSGSGEPKTRLNYLGQLDVHLLDLYILGW